MKHMKKKTIIVSVLFGILIIGIVSAGLLDYFGKVTGSVEVEGPVFYLNGPHSDGGIYHKLYVNEIPPEEEIYFWDGNRLMFKTEDLDVEEFYPARFEGSVWMRTNNSGNAIQIRIIKLDVNNYEKTICEVEDPIILETTTSSTSDLVCNLYDDFSSETLDTNKWEILPNNQNWPLTDEYFIKDGIYHMAQLNTRPAATGLEIINKIFYPGDVVEYDVNYISGSGNRVHTISLNGLSHQWALIGFWNTIQDGGVGNDLGMWHVKITFIENGVITEMTKPDGTRGTSIYCPTGFCYLNSPGSEHTLGIVTGLGHNGLVHMDYDNVIICTEESITDFRKYEFSCESNGEINLTKYNKIGVELRGTGDEDQEYWISTGINRTSTNDTDGYSRIEVSVI